MLKLGIKGDDNMIQLHGTIPVKGYLHKYALQIENLGENEALDLTQSGIIGFQLKLLLSNKTNVNHQDSVSVQTMSKFDARLKFKVTSRLMAYNGFFISKKNIVVFNSFLHQLFHEELFRKILKAEIDGIPIKDTIFDFAEQYGILVDEEISFEALKKSSYRLRNMRKIGVFSQQCGI